MPTINLITSVSACWGTRARAYKSTHNSASLLQGYLSRIYKGDSLQCKHIFGGRKLLVYVCTVVTAIFVIMDED